MNVFIAVVVLLLFLLLLLSLLLLLLSLLLLLLSLLSLLSSFQTGTKYLKILIKTNYLVDVTITSVLLSAQKEM